MNIKNNLEVSTQDFWYDLSNGYLDPFDICEKTQDAIAIQNAFELIKEFENSCSEEIDGFNH